MKKLILFLVVVGSAPLFSQKQANIWYFGAMAGLDFNGGAPVALNDGQMTTAEGCASVANEDGELLFYTDGRNVWNRMHTIMPNGMDLMGHTSSTQSSIVIPRPGSPNIYYIFTADAVEGNDNGYRYSQVDMNLDGTLGDIVNTEKNIELYSPGAEKLTAVYHANQKDIWVLTHGKGTDEFNVYLVTESGVNPVPEVSNIGPMVGVAPNVRGNGGSLKVSPSGNKLAMASVDEGAYLFDFDNVSGEVKNPIVLRTGSPAVFYGLEFSPNDQLLYLTTHRHSINRSTLTQYNLLAPNIRASEIEIAVEPFILGALQLGPDRKIYVAKNNEEDFLGVINNPNGLGDLCNYNSAGVSLEGRISFAGLPTFISTFFTDFSFFFTGTCHNTTTVFSINIVPDSVIWDFGEPSSGIANTSNELNPSHTYGDTGSYTVTLITINGNDRDTSTRIVTIDPIDDPTFNYSSSNLCSTDSNIVPLITGSTGGTFTIDNNGIINANTGEIDVISSGENNYTVTYETNGACPLMSTANITIVNCPPPFSITIPNVFTPNGDNENDIFIVDVSGIKSIEIEIFNRWGQKLFDATGMDEGAEGWDGNTSGGTEAPSGTYYYVIKAIRSSNDEESSYHGSVSLFR